MDELAELSILSDAEVESLCKLVCKPGGLIPSPHAIYDGHPVMINVHGYTLSMREVINFKSACYFIYHHTRMSSDCSPAIFVLADVQKLGELRELKESYKIPDSPPTINKKNCPNTLKSVVIWMVKHLRVEKTPSSTSSGPQNSLPETIDPAFGVAGTEYSFYQDEMTKRAPLFSASNTVSTTNIMNNNAVWELVQKLCKENICWTVYVEAYQGWYERLHSTLQPLFGAI